MWHDYIIFKVLLPHIFGFFYIKSRCDTHTHTHTHKLQLYAVKMVNVKKAEKNGVPVDALKREVHMLLRLSHPNVVRYFTCYMYKQVLSVYVYIHVCV